LADAAGGAQDGDFVPSRRLVRVDRGGERARGRSQRGF
jgi:hypothetical protein